MSRAYEFQFKEIVKEILADEAKAKEQEAFKNKKGGKGYINAHFY